MHQINVERLARVVERRDGWAFPDTCLGTDSHTTMVNGLGVLAWGVGGVEAEAALLGLPLALAVPPVVEVELVGRLRPGVTATDLVLTAHAAAARPRRGRQVRGVRRRRRWPCCRVETAHHDRQHGSGVRRHDAGCSPSTTRRSATCG